ncbi:MAG: hypothetical protein A2001_05700 [Treponema sp. GWC1_61_84]|nr:MAG: hypothetical protein A2001_05700 [Treponema sp. GWC1_61_84]
MILALEASRIPPGAVDRIRAAGGGREVLVRSGKAEIESALDRAEIVAGDFPASLLAAAPRLKWFQAWYAGTDWLQKMPETKELPFLLTSASGVHGEQMTEHLFGLLFAWNRKFPRAFAAQSRREWADFKHSEMSTLAGKTMLILGYGTIGERFGRAAEAFGMHVIGVRRTAGSAAAASAAAASAAAASAAAASAAAAVTASGPRVIALADLSSALAEADVVVNILPLTPETRNFYDAVFFARMKREALFANMGRGGSVDEDALADALKSGTIAGALLDVTATEPLPPASPLWELPNLILTSHYSGFHPHYDEMVLEIFLDNLGRYGRGEDLRNVVDKRLGY